MNAAYRLKNLLKRWLRRPWKFFLRLPRDAMLFSARAASGVLPKAFAVDTDRLYPPRTVCKSTSDWVAATGGALGARFREVDPAQAFDNPLPKTVHARVRQQFLIDLVYDYPQTFVARIPQGRVWGDGFIITPDNRVLDDVSIDFRALATKQSSVMLDWNLRPLTEIDGTMAVLATDGGNLYYHWLFQLLPRLELMRLAGIDLDSIDYFLVNSQKSRFQRDTLALLGIAPSRILESAGSCHMRARDLVVPSIPLGGGCFRPWMCDFLRRAFISRNPDDVKIGGRRLYINREKAGYRRVLNEPEVVQLLRRRGFESVAFEDLTVPQQAATMAACEVVVGPHGGGLSNLVFCTPGTKVIEIFSPELVAAYFWKICNRVGLDYYYMLGKGEPATLEPDYPQSWSSREDIVVDLATLEKTLDLADVR